MYPNLHLIDSLRSVGEKVLDTESEWVFSDSWQCNCGLLAQELGVDYQLVNDSITGYWFKEVEEKKEYAPKICPQTGLPLTPIFKVLASFGITQEDIFQ